MTAERGTAPFHIERAAFDARTGEISLHYYFEDGASFVERIVVPVRRDGSVADPVAFEAALRVLLLVAGTSYYKSAAPERVVVDDPAGITSAEADMLYALYDHGLREFAWRNELAIPLVTEWSHGDRPSSRSLERIDHDVVRRPLVPFGGGKDSTVVVSMLPEAEVLTVNPTSHHRQLSAAMGHELIEVRRTVDRLDLLTSVDALNGHVPITAIVSATAVVVAALWGHDVVVMADEDAADEPTLISECGDRINHQYSKSAEFEALLRSALDEAGVGVGYFSLLRGLGESQIIALLADRPELIGRILSCNNAFGGLVAGGAEREQAWCGHCPKCCFTYLMLAVVMAPDELSGVFGSDLLDRDELIEPFADLWNAAKPFECVGEREDAASAMLALAGDARWKDHHVVRTLADRAGDKLAVSGGRERSGATASIPAPYLARRDAALAAIGADVGNG